jgi:hypothetical protein
MFNYFGQTFRLHPEFGVFALTDWLEEYGELDEKDPRSVMAIKFYVRMMVDPEQFDAFWILVKKHRQTPQDMMTLSHKLLEGLTGRPIELPSDSSDGQGSTSGSSTGDSSSPVVRRLEKQGRPELALLVRRTEQDRAARAS